MEEMVAVLRRWQGLERQAMSDTAEIMEKTRSPFIRILMEIIRHDSLMHHRVQQFMLDTLTTQALVVSREDVVEVWNALEAHDKMEKKTIEMAEKLLTKSISPVHKQLLEYLLTDEQKHDALIMKLNDVKKGMAQASGG